MSTVLDDYYNEKKKEFFIEIDNGDHGGVFFYKMIFKEKVTRRAFLDAMEESRVPQNRYASLYDEAFREKHHIESFEEIHVDFQDMLEEEYWEISYDPETGKYQARLMSEEDWDDTEEEVEDV